MKPIGPDDFGGEDTPHSPSADTLRRALVGLPGASYLCAGCDRWHPAGTVSLCADCGAVVCATCPATCPHREPEPQQSTFLGFWEGKYGRYTAITTDKE